MMTLHLPALRSTIAQFLVGCALLGVVAVPLSAQMPTVPTANRACALRKIATVVEQVSPLEQHERCYYIAEICQCGEIVIVDIDNCALCTDSNGCPGCSGNGANCFDYAGAIAIGGGYETSPPAGGTLEGGKRAPAYTNLGSPRPESVTSSTFTDAHLSPLKTIQVRLDTDGDMEYDTYVTARLYKYTHNNQVYWFAIGQQALTPTNPYVSGKSASVPNFSGLVVSTVIPFTENGVTKYVNVRFPVMTNLTSVPTP